jgi:DNA topoisomerase-1
VELPGEGSVGLITYMRTDSVNLAEKFLAEAREAIGHEFGAAYQLSQPRRFANRSKNAQEAHEAIRPTEASRTPASLASKLEPHLAKLYDLIWRRAIASQMPEAQFTATASDLGSADGQLAFRATGNVLRRDGYLKVYPQRFEEAELPPLSQGAAVSLLKVEPTQHFTEPPARYSEAALVKALEAHGIGRPSTYAPTIGTLITRKYVDREQRRLIPTDTGTAVNDLLVEHFPRIVDLSFTAALEQQFDDIADGVRPWVPVVADFYGPFHEQLQQKEREVSRKDFTEEKTDEACPKSGHPLIIKLGRYGKFLACTGYPDCRYTAPLPGSAEAKAQAEAAEAPTGETCPECHQGTLVPKRSRYGSFLGCSRYPDCRYIKKQQDRTGVQCPECKAGELVGKRGARGKTFYSCDRYPDCRCAIWARPLGEACPTCGWPLVMGAKDTFMF